ARADDVDINAPLSLSERTETMTSRQFTLRDKQTIPPAGERDRILLEEYPVPSHFTYLAIPKRADGAILKAGIPGWDDIFLLPGQAKLHLEGAYVGQTYLNPGIVSDTLDVSFGRDNGIIVTRTKVSDQSERSFFRNRVTQTVVHEITVCNTKGSTAQIEVRDQIPVSTREEIEVSTAGLSGGELNVETGIVTWQLQIAQGESRTLRVGYEVRYPSGKTVILE
ncbi:DUF4139 domain-containing protein, partial [Pleurocapsales cyanobacterium LEGE 10410]|nr:DUF4139 domain-containing protein [Pleurocapsales cyanobacterium LEGE 10410]